MQRNDKQQKSAGRIGRRGPVLLAAMGLLTGALAVGASAARHHAPHTVRHHTVHYARRASGGGSYNEEIEHSLAGIHIGDSYRTVLARFGNPSETQLEEIELVAAGTNGTTTPPPGPATGTAGALTVPVKIFVGPTSTTPGGAGGSPSSSPGAGNGLAGALSGALGALGGGSLFQEMGGMPGQGGAGATGSLIKPEHPEYRWIYDEPNSNSLEFTFSPEGSVIQIRATGYQSFVHTNRGIQLGVKFSQVILAYGNPEKQNYDGPILSADYTDRSHVGFQFFNQRLVGITVASVE